MCKALGWNVFLLGVALALTGASSPAALAGGPTGKSACGCGPRWCCDDYCPKPCPKICLPSYCGGCDTYCPKLAPCIKTPAYCGGCDTYCPKPEPCVQIPCTFPCFYRCPPKSGCGDWRNNLRMLPMPSQGKEAPVTR